MVEFVIKNLETSDTTAILEVYQACEDFLALGPQPRASIDMVKKDMEETQDLGGVFTGIFIPNDPSSTQKKKRGRLAGVLSYIPAGFEGNPDVAFLWLLMIAAPFRHLGLGSAVVGWLETHLRQSGKVTRIQSGVQVNNPQAIRFWLRQGYQIIGPAQLMPDTTTAFPLEKKLS